MDRMPTSSLEYFYKTAKNTLLCESKWLASSLSPAMYSQRPKAGKNAFCSHAIPLPSYSLNSLLHTSPTLLYNWDHLMQWPTLLSCSLSCTHILANSWLEFGPWIASGEYSALGETRHATLSLQEYIPQWRASHASKAWMISANANFLFLQSLSHTHTRTQLFVVWPMNSHWRIFIPLWDGST
jgi:hypothetical protein